MAHRFFKDNWGDIDYSSLSTKEKLLFKFFWEQADIAGVYKYLLPIVSAHVGFNVDQNVINELVKKINSRKMQIHLFDENKLWFIEFPRFQQFPNKPDNSLSDKHTAHKSVVNSLKVNGLFDYACELDPVLFKHYLRVGQGLNKAHNNSVRDNAFNGHRNRVGDSPPPTPYSQSKAIAERINTSNFKNDHEAIKRVSVLAERLKKKGVTDPFSEIEYRISELEEYDPKTEITIEALEVSLTGESYAI